MTSQEYFQLFMLWLVFGGFAFVIFILCEIARHMAIQNKKMFFEDEDSEEKKPVDPSSPYNIDPDFDPSDWWKHEKKD